MFSSKLLPNIKKSSDSDLITYKLTINMNENLAIKCHPFHLEEIRNNYKELVKLTETDRKFGLML